MTVFVRSEKRRDGMWSSAKTFESVSCLRMANGIRKFRRDSAFSYSAFRRGTSSRSVVGSYIRLTTYTYAGLVLIPRSVIWYLLVYSYLRHFCTPSAPSMDTWSPKLQEGPSTHASVIQPISFCWRALELCSIVREQSTR